MVGSFFGQDSVICRTKSTIMESPSDCNPAEETMHTIAIRLRPPLYLAVFLFACRAASLMAQGDASLGSAPAAEVNFATEVLPILQSHCYACHGPSDQQSGFRLDVREIAFRGGDSAEAAIIPHHADASPLFRFVSLDVTETSSATNELRMPPEDSDSQPLTAKQISILRTWIDQGAAWPGELAGAVETKPLWSLRPVVRPSVPTLPDGRAFANPIDSFIAVKLSEHGLTISQEEEPRTLLRRLTFGLTGLPPEPTQIDAYLSDLQNEKQAGHTYELMVSNLLDSPRYGERWARHWLDVVRFAESNGFEMNQPRPNAWRYRDYVIDAFNQDMPYDQFMREQIAGDSLGADLGTGFIVGGPWDQVKSPDPVLTAQQRSDELHDMVSTTGSAFLGLTVGCARCHNHKFDPITQRDYFAMVACLSGVQHGERPIEKATNPDVQQTVEHLRSEIQKISAELEALVPLAFPKTQEANAASLATPNRPPVNAIQNTERLAPVSAKYVKFTIKETNTGAEPCLDELELWTGDGRNVAVHATLSSSGDFSGNERHQLHHLIDGQAGNDRSWISNTAGTGWVVLELPNRESIVKVVWGRDRKEQFADRLPVRYKIECSDDGTQWNIAADSFDRMPFSSPRTPETDWKVIALSKEQRDLAEVQEATLANLQVQLKQLISPTTAYVGKMEQPVPTYRLSRGDPMQPKEPIAPGGIQAVGNMLSMPDDMPEQQRRVQLANWIANANNPLPARVMVNRIWQYHFGVGLVDTPSDFGHNGGGPSHPELLDWLASEFIESGWSVKQLQKRILTSQAYRQSSQVQSDGLRVDANNRWLWRFSPRRLEAEAIRDSILAVSGQLDLRMGGPGFDLFVPNTNYVRVYETKTQFGEGDFRRMIYQNKPRVELDSLFGVFDCPDGGQIQPKRNVSITPLQALNLLNSEFLIDQAKRFAERLESSAGNDTQGQAALAFRLAFGRPPDAKESSASEQLISQHGLAVFCRALYNSNEFLSVR